MHTIYGIITNKKKSSFFDILNIKNTKVVDPPIKTYNWTSTTFTLQKTCFRVCNALFIRLILSSLRGGLIVP